jgi:hypothetical protein
MLLFRYFVVSIFCCVNILLFRYFVMSTFLLLPQFAIRQNCIRSNRRRIVDPSTQNNDILFQNHQLGTYYVENWPESTKILITIILTRTKIENNYFCIRNFYCHFSAYITFTYILSFFRIYYIYILSFSANIRFFVIFPNPSFIQSFFCSITASNAQRRRICAASFQ